MQKTYCDRCDALLPSYSSVKVQLGRIRDFDYWVFMNLCPACQARFVALLESFKPNFFSTGSGYPKKVVTKKRKKLFKWI